MSGFAALTGLEGDHTEIVKQKQKAKAEKEEEAAAKANKAKLKFEELKAKAGRGAWGDSDDEDDMFASPPVRCAPAACPLRLSSLPVLSACPPCLSSLPAFLLCCQTAHERRCCVCRWRLPRRRQSRLD